MEPQNPATEHMVPGQDPCAASPPVAPAKLVHSRKNAIIRPDSARAVAVPTAAETTNLAPEARRSHRPWNRYGGYRCRSPE